MTQATDSNCCPSLSGAALTIHKRFYSRHPSIQLLNEAGSQSPVYRSSTGEVEAPQDFNHCKISCMLSQIVGHHRNKWWFKTDFNNFSNLLCSTHPLILHNQEFLKASCLARNYMNSPFCPMKQNRSFLVAYRQAGMKGFEMVSLQLQRPVV